MNWSAKSINSVVKDEVFSKLKMERQVHTMTLMTEISILD